MKKPSKSTVFLVAGTYGAIALLVAYALVSTEKCAPRDFWPLFLNLTGGLAFIADNTFRRSWATVGLNICWVAIALYGIGRALFG
ncbi:MAG: hypothetical protein PHT12_00540 [Patescibacteria group bacterium]|nr:hypothetical protein [Patescibacteria group bacterium]